MTSKERIQAILNGKTADRVGFWLGNPVDETKSIYGKYFDIDKKADVTHDDALLTSHSLQFDVELNLKFKSDVFWYTPEYDPDLWKHPENKPIFDVYGGKERKSLNQPGYFAACDDLKMVKDFDWPNPDYLDFSSIGPKVDYIASHGFAIFSGMWMPFFHIMCDFFGMDNYFMKMYTHPQIVEAVTERILDFYLEANKRYLDIVGNKIDAVFFGNDLGSQQNLLVSPQALNQFVLPGIHKVVEQANSYGLKVVLHSCGSIFDWVPTLINAGIDALHPLQALARKMDAENLANHFKNDIAFIGGLDTQNVLPFASPCDVENKVCRLKKVFGERFIVSPSHEALLPNVSIENALAMRDAALE